MPQPRSNASDSPGEGSRSSLARSGSGRSASSRSGRSTASGKAGGSGGRSAAGGGTRASSARGSSSRAKRVTASTAKASSAATGRSDAATGRSDSATGRSDAATAGAAHDGGDPRVEALADRVRNLNERIIAASRDAGETTLSAYEKALKAIAASLERGAEGSDIEWFSQLLTTQANFIRDVTNTWMSAARQALK